MLDKPRLADEDMRACLAQSYGLMAGTITFLPLGYDSRAGVYRAEVGGQDYFVKVKQDTIDPVTVLLPRYLQDHGISEVVAPIAAQDGALWGTAGDYSVLVYPFITEVRERPLSEEHRRIFGALLRRIHSIELPADLAALLRRETFAPNPVWLAAAEQIQGEVGNRVYENPIEQEAADYWRTRQKEIALIIRRTKQLGERLRERSPETVLCHSDIHTGNLLIDMAGGLHIVDWDQPVLAPRECDLLFVAVGGFVTDPREEVWFFVGYGQTRINPLALAFYRYERAMEDIGAFGESVFSPESSDETKRDALYWIRQQFEPGGMVEAARSLDHPAGL